MSLLERACALVGRGAGFGVLGIFLTGCATQTGGCPAAGLPFTVDDALFDQQRPADLGLERIEGTETTTIFRPEEGDNTYNHGVVLLPFKKRLYAQWQTSARDEDAPDTHVVYSTSGDGTEWTKPVVIAGPDEEGIRTSGGWWSDGEMLVAYINVWPIDVDPRGGHTEYRTSLDGQTWSQPRRVLAADGKPVEGIIEQDPHALADGRIIGAFHMQPGLIVSPWFTDDPLGVSGWSKGDIELLPNSDPHISRELEPSWYERKDGVIVMVFRDQAGSFRKLASMSCDRGASWTQPVVTAMPDARTKQSAGNLPDGSAFFAGNLVAGKDRFPLATALSRNGAHFDNAWLLRDGAADLKPMRYPGRFKRAGYSYTKSIVWKGHLYIAYATNKEDIEVTRVPLQALVAGK